MSNSPTGATTAEVWPRASGDRRRRPRREQISRPLNATLRRATSMRRHNPRNFINPARRFDRADPRRGRDTKRALAGDEVALVLDRPVDVSRGDVLADLESFDTVALGVTARKTGPAARQGGSVRRMGLHRQRRRVGRDRRSGRDHQYGAILSV